MRHPYSGAFLLMAAAVIFMVTKAEADLLIFYNGAYEYGDVAHDPAKKTYVLTLPNGATEMYTNRQVRSFHPGIQRPALGEVVRVSDFVHSATAEDQIFDITGDITHSQEVSFPDGKKIDLAVQNDYAVPALRLQPTSFSFYNRRGTYMVFRIQNNTDTTQESVTFRVSVFDPQDNLLVTRDFFVRRLPPSTPDGRGGRVINVELPDVLYEQIGGFRIVRKY